MDKVRNNNRKDTMRYGKFSNIRQAIQFPPLIYLELRVQIIKTGIAIKDIPDDLAFLLTQDRFDLGEFCDDLALPFLLSA
jgi:hypothetical protein